MKLIKRVNLLDDKKLIMKLNILTIPLLVIFFALFTLLTLDRKLTEEVTIDLMYLVIAILSMAGLIIVHELIHGIFFKLFNKEGKVKFGFKNGLAYATSPNSFYSRWQFLLILLAPFCSSFSSRVPSPLIGISGLAAKKMIFPSGEWSLKYSERS